MCLSRVYKDRKKERAINILDVRVDGYIWLWKSFRVNRGGEIRPTNFDCIMYEGLNTAKGGRINTSEFEAGHSYKAGFHCFTTERNAKSWGYQWSGYVVVPVKVEKEWITDVGIQNGQKVVVCKHIII